MNEPEEIDKFGAASRQIDQAIKLFFEDGDAVSAYTLTMAARDILYNLSQHQGKKTGMDDFMAIIKPDKRDEVLGKIKEPQLFFKHAKDDPDAKLEFTPRSYEMLLLMTVIMYAELSGNPTLNMEKYFCWNFLDNPKILGIPAKLVPLDKDGVNLLYKWRKSIDKKSFWKFSETEFQNVTLLRNLASTMMRHRNQGS